MLSNEEYKIKKIERLEENVTKESLAELLEMIKDENEAVRLSAIDALINFSAFPEAKDTLIELTGDDDILTRCHAIESLSNYSGVDVGDAVLSRLYDSDELVRISAAEVLGKIKPRDAVRHLKQALSDKSELVRGYAAVSLGQTGDRSLIPVLKESLDKEKRNAARLRFYVGLYLLGEKQFFYEILQMLKTKSYRVRIAATSHLLELANETNAGVIVDGIKKALSKEDTIAAKSAMKKAISALCEIFDVDDCGKDIDNS